MNIRRQVIVKLKATGETHLFDTFCASDAEAIEIAQKTYQHGCLWELSVRAMECVAVCKNCGRRQILSSGLVAGSITMSRKAAMLKSLGWKSAPFLLCNYCANPQSRLSPPKRKKNYR